MYYCFEVISLRSGGSRRRFGFWSCSSHVATNGCGIFPRNLRRPHEESCAGVLQLLVPELGRRAVPNAVRRSPDSRGGFCGDGLLAAGGRGDLDGLRLQLGRRHAHDPARAARGLASSPRAVHLVMLTPLVRVHVLRRILLPLPARPRAPAYARPGGHGAVLPVRHRRLRGVQGPDRRPHAHAAPPPAAVRSDLHGRGDSLPAASPGAALRRPGCPRSARRRPLHSRVVGSNPEGRVDDQAARTAPRGATVAKRRCTRRGDGLGGAALGQVPVRVRRRQFLPPLVVLPGLQRRHLRHSPVRPRRGQQQPALHRSQSSMMPSSPRSHPFPDLMPVKAPTLQNPDQYVL